MTVWLPQHNQVWLHIQKTGGTWQRKAFAAAGIKCVELSGLSGSEKNHHIPSEIARPEGCPAVHDVAFVRHPITWAESLWRFANHTRWKPRQRTGWQPLKHCPHPYGKAFNQWIYEVLNRQPGICSRIYEWHIGPESAETVVDFGRTERLVEDTIRILNNGETPLNRDQEHAIRATRAINTSRGKGPAIEWDPDLRDAWLKAERPAIDRFYGTDDFESVSINAGRFRYSDTDS